MFKGCHFPTEVILDTIRYYHAYKLSYREIEEIQHERGVHVDHATITVSDDLVFETESCIDCHGDAEDLDGPQHNLVHRDQEEMQCASCHLPHEEFDVKESCLDCHEESDEQLEGFY